MKCNLKIGLGNAIKNGTISFAKLFGLSISFAVILFVAGYAYYETGFDRSIPEHDRIYRCLVQGYLNDEEIDYATTTAALAPVISTDIPEIAETVRVLNGYNAILIYDHEDFNIGNHLWADSSFFSFFGIPVITELENPLESFTNVVISRSVAEKMFGSAENALNKSVTLRGIECSISGVFENFPDNFHLHAEIVQPLIITNPGSIGWDIQSSSIYGLCYTYFKTNRSDFNIDELNFKITQTAYTYNNQGINGADAANWDDFRSDDGTLLKYVAEPLTDIHFSNHKFDMANTTNKTNVIGAIILAVFVLLISSVNFINLTMANISTRLKEVGILKTNGAKDNQILLQFLIEILIFCTIGFFTAVVIFKALEKPLFQYLDLDIVLSNIMLSRILLVFFFGLTGVYVLASLLPIRIITGKKGLDLISSDASVRNRFFGNKGFILIQFILSALIIICSFVVQKQINFMVNKDRGYNTENIMRLNLWVLDSLSKRSFIEDLRRYDVVEAVSTSNEYLGEVDFGMADAYFETTDENNYFLASYLTVDEGFLKTFDLQMKEGRFFESDRQSDLRSVILNEAAIKLYRGNGSVMGKFVLIDSEPLEVIGIVKDFNFRSLHHPIGPLIIRCVANTPVLYIKMKNERTAEVLSIVRDLWDGYNLDYQIQYNFHNDALIAQYKQDQFANRILLLLSIVSVLIACVGLYAISLFSIVRRVKEIGIRKVNGARISEVMVMLNSDFVKWVGIAFVIATPIAYYAMNKWLQNFAYKTGLSWWIFGLAGLLALGIALLTVSWQSYRAASRNPVEALRYE